MHYSYGLSGDVLAWYSGFYDASCARVLLLAVRMHLPNVMLKPQRCDVEASGGPPNY